MRATGRVSVASKRDSSGSEGISPRGQSAERFCAASWREGCLHIVRRERRGIWHERNRRRDMIYDIPWRSNDSE